MALAVAHQAVGGTESSTSATISSAAMATTSGNLILVFVRYSAGTLTSVTDTAGNTYTKVAGASEALNNEWFGVYVAHNITGNAANVVTTGQAVTFASMYVYEISGAATSNAVDAAVATSTATLGNTITSPSFSTAQANEIVLMCCSAAGTRTMSGTSIGGTAVTAGPNVVTNTVSGYVIESAIQSSITATATIGGSTSAWGISVVSIKAVASAPVATTPYQGPATRQSGFPFENATAAATTLAITQVAIGDLVICHGRLYVSGGTAITVTGVSGGGVTTWTKVTDQSDTTVGVYEWMWWGKSTATGAATITVTYSAAITGINNEINCDAFTGSSSWALDKSGVIKGDVAVSTLAFPSLTPAAAGAQSLYFGRADVTNNAGTASVSPGTFGEWVTTGHGSGTVFSNNAVGGVAQAPTIGVSGGGTSTYAAIAAIFTGTMETDSFPNSPILDNFNRANGAVGSNWGLIDPGYPLPTITSNQAVSTGAAGAAVSAYWVQAFGPDQEVYMYTASYALDSNNIMLRVTGMPATTESGYEVRVYGDHLDINLVNGGVRTLLYSAKRGKYNGNYVGMRARGNILSVWESTDGATWIKSATVADATFINGGVIGYFNNHSVTIDDFGGGDAGRHRGVTCLQATHRAASR